MIAFHAAFILECRLIMCAQKGGGAFLLPPSPFEKSSPPVETALGSEPLLQEHQAGFAAPNAPISCCQNEQHTPSTERTTLIKTTSVAIANKQTNLAKFPFTKHLL